LDHWYEYSGTNINQDINKDYFKPKEKGALFSNPPDFTRLPLLPI